MNDKKSIDEEAKDLGIRFIRDLETVSKPLRQALLDAVEDMTNDDRELRETA